LHRLPARARRRYIVRACIPAFLIVGPVWAFAWYFGLMSLGLSSLLLVLLAGLIGDWRYRDAGWFRIGDGLVFRTRRLARTVAIVTRRRIQLCSVSQSIFQRRKDLATFAVRVASGHTGATFLIKDIEFSDGQRLYAWVGGRQNN
jgi:putative membrane protein